MFINMEKILILIFPLYWETFTNNVKIITTAIWRSTLDRQCDHELKTKKVYTFVESVEDQFDGLSYRLSFLWDQWRKFWIH